MTACGGADGSAAAEPGMGLAAPASLAQQTVGADLLPPDADIAGAPTTTDLSATDLSPDDAALASPSLDDEALPPA